MVKLSRTEFIIVIKQHITKRTLIADITVYLFAVTRHVGVCMCRVQHNSCCNDELLFLCEKETLASSRNSKIVEDINAKLGKVD
jgi:hypothetical protein